MKAVRWDNDVDQAGFTMVPNVVLRNAGLSMQARVLYGVLASYAWQEDSCFPGQSRLAVDLGVSDRQVRTITRELENAGLVTVEQPGLGRTNRYVLHRPGEAPDRSHTSGLTGATLPGIEEDTGKEDSVTPVNVPKKDSRVDEIFRHWQEVFGKQRSRLTSQRRKKIEARLKEGFEVDQLKRAIDGCFQSDFHRVNGHVDLTLICRSEEKLEFFLGLHEPGADDDFFAGAGV